MPGLTLKMSDAQIQALEEQLIAELKRRAIDQKIASPADILVRDIMPYTDMGFTDEYFSQSLASATAWNAVATDTDLDGKKLIGIMGVRLLTAIPLVKLMRFSLGAGGSIIKDIWNVEQIQVSNGIVEGYSREPIIYNKNDTTNIDAWCGATTGTELLVLIGKVAEPAGQQIMGGK